MSSTTPPVLVDRDHTSLTIGWNLQQPPASSPLFELQIKIDESDDEWKTLSSKLSNNVIKKKNLIPGKPYLFRVRVVADESSSSFSYPSEPFYVVSNASMIMSPPTFVTSDATSITFKWEEVQGAEGYRIRFRVSSRCHTIMKASR
jgi:hypothetical protein